MLSYEQRLAKIDSVAELDNQLRLAINTVKRIKGKLRNAGSFSEQMLFYRPQLKVAEQIVRKLRANYFDIEEQMNQSLTLNKVGIYGF